MELGTLDVILLAMIIGYAFWGLFKGFVNQIASILAIIAGVWCAFKFTTFLAAYLKEWFSLTWDESTINILAFASILVFVIIIGNIIGKGIENLFSFASIGWINRILGFVFAGFKATLILSLLSTVFNKMNDAADLVPKEYFDKSIVYSWLETFADKVFPYLGKLIH